MTTPRGFVLSFAVLIISLFILIYAQVQADHAFRTRLNESTVWQAGVAARFAQDARMDLNYLMDERVGVDQNATHVRSWISGSLPSHIPLSTMLTRYATDLSSLAGDSNLSATLNAASAIADGNVYARLSTDFEWVRNLSGSVVIFRERTPSFLPLRYDINITASQPYTSVTPWSLDGSGNVFVTLRYTDQNTDHTTLDSGWITSNASLKTYVWDYGEGAARVRLQTGILNRLPASIYLDSNNTSGVTVSYTVSALQAATSNVTAGYDIPLTVVGADGNVVMSRQYLQN